MESKNWIYYNHAFVPTTAPHEAIDDSLVSSGEIFKNAKQSAYLARWTSDFDCKRETDWWFLIKDDVFDINALKSKERYRIKRGMSFFEVKRINPIEYAEELSVCQEKAFDAYPKKYRPKISKEDAIKSFSNLSEGDYFVYGAFFKDSGELAGFSYLKINEKFWGLNVLKTNPAFEKYDVNAALVEKILEDFNEYFSNGTVSYICDGERNILHETAFQQYLEKYFHFRKAYCRLNLIYNPKIRWIIKVLYPFRKILYKLEGINFIHQISGVMKMEEIVRKQEKCWNTD